MPPDPLQCHGGARDHGEPHHPRHLPHQQGGHARVVIMHHTPGL